jgi:hypothetical protein
LLDSSPPLKLALPLTLIGLAALRPAHPPLTVAPPHAHTARSPHRQPTIAILPALLRPFRQSAYVFRLAFLPLAWTCVD